MDENGLSFVYDTAATKKKKGSADPREIIMLTELAKKVSPNLSIKRRPIVFVSPKVVLAMFFRRTNSFL